MIRNSALQTVLGWYGSGRHAFPGSPRTVQVGDRFYKAAGPHRVWRVARLFQPALDGLPHAVVVHDDEVQDRTVISIDALADRSIFRPAQGHADAAG